MIIVIPITNNLQWDAPVSDHFGHAPFFALVDCAADSIQVLDSSIIRRPSECAPLTAFREAGVHAMLCRHMGRGALVRCHEFGFQVYAAQGETVREAIDAFRSGSDTALTDDALCHSGEDRCQHTHH